MTEKCWSVNGEDFFDDWGLLVEELLIQAWAEKHVNLPYWRVQNVVKKVVTEEDSE